MDTYGQHLLVELHGCDAARLDDTSVVEDVLRRAAEQVGATVLRSVSHRYAPHGVTGFVLVEESHLSAHTWPERGYAAVDFFTCARCAPADALVVLGAGFGAARVEWMIVERGLGAASPSLRAGAVVDREVGPR